MSRQKRILIALAVVGASFVPASSALAGINLFNHSETLLGDE